jgi:hypothetical protein
MTEILPAASPAPRVAAKLCDALNKQSVEVGKLSSSDLFNTPSAVLLCGIDRLGEVGKC